MAIWEILPEQNDPVLSVNLPAPWFAYCTLWQWLTYLWKITTFNGYIHYFYGGSFQFAMSVSHETRGYWCWVRWSDDGLTGFIIIQQMEDLIGIDFVEAQHLGFVSDIFRNNFPQCLGTWTTIYNYFRKTHHRCNFDHDMFGNCLEKPTV